MARARSGAPCSFYCWCMICGVKVGHYPQGHVEAWRSAAKDAEEWTSTALLIEGPAWSYGGLGPESMTIPDSTVKIYPAKVYWSRLSIFRILDDEEQQVSIQAEKDDKAGDNQGTDADCRWCFVIHPACLDIASRVMKTSSNASVRSVGDLWMTLDRRCARQQFEAWRGPPHLPIVPSNSPTEPLSLGLQGYYIPKTLYRECHGIWDCDDSVLQWWNASPTRIDGLTTSLIGNLQPYETKNNAVYKFQKNFNLLPQELKDMIIALVLEQPLSLRCNYMMPQSYWKQEFLSIPFLWDLDKDYFKNRLPHHPLGSEWDWERIVRQLMSRVEFVRDDGVLYGYCDTHPRAWDYSEVGLVVPPGLTNRRRIWQLLEDMYPNDVGYDQVIGRSRRRPPVIPR